MHCEIEFLPVGMGSKAGDAIVVRYGYDHDFKLMLIDGGHANTGEEIIEHLRDNFGAEATFEHVLLTHSDADHASGLRAVLENVSVSNLWLHIPWLLAEESRHLFKNKQWTEDRLKAAIKAEYDIVSEVVDLAVAQGTTLYYPFQGANIGPFRVCSPTQYVYKYLLPQFEKTPDPDQAAIEVAGMWIRKESAVTKIVEAARAAIQSWTTESWDNERLRDGGVTSASNESSVVLYGAFDNANTVLLTGDAGLNGLRWSADYADKAGLPLQLFSFVQIPHHGSRRNSGPSLLNRLVGPKLPQGTDERYSAYVSAPVNDDQHPRRIVLNAFKRRGGRIYATQGGKKVYWGGFTPRAGYSTATGLPFYTEVEEYT